MKPRRRKPDPILLGAPSPSLSKMNKMGAAELTSQVDRLGVEADRLSAKIERLTAHKPSPVERIGQLKVQLERLNVLKKAAQERLTGRDDRRYRPSAPPPPAAPRL